MGNALGGKQSQAGSESVHEVFFADRSDFTSSKEAGHWDGSQRLFDGCRIVMWFGEESCASSVTTKQQAAAGTD